MKAKLESTSLTLLIRSDPPSPSPDGGWGMAGGCSVGCGSSPPLGAVAAVNSADRARAKSPSPVSFSHPPPLAPCATFSSFLFLSAYSGYATICLCVLCLGDSSRLAGRSLVEASSLSAISVRAVSPIPITRCSFAINLYPLNTLQTFPSVGPRRLKRL